MATSNAGKGAARTRRITLTPLGTSDNSSTADTMVQGWSKLCAAFVHGRGSKFGSWRAGRSEPSTDGVRSMRDRNCLGQQNSGSWAA